MAEILFYILLKRGCFYDKKKKTSKLFVCIIDIYQVKYEKLSNGSTMSLRD